jgi:hypothetical protein
MMDMCDAQMRWETESLLPFDQLSVPQRMLLYSRLAKVLAGGHLGFLPRRAYGDAALVHLFRELTISLKWEIEALQQEWPPLDEGPAQEVPTWRDLIRDAAREVGFEDDVLRDDSGLHAWQRAIECIEATLDIDALVYTDAPLFDAAPRDEYWAPLLYTPSMSMAGVCYRDMDRTITQIKEQLDPD